MSSRIYLDFNASSPLAPPVIEWLSGSFHEFANPSSVHTSGKKARRMMERASSYLYELFGLSKKGHQLFFHSGATEGINTLIQGYADLNGPIHFIFNSTDHSCISNLAEFLRAKGHKVSTYGDRELEKLKKILKKANDAGECVLVNWTWVNNETGLIFSLDNLVQLKKEYDFKVHVDGVQAIGKIKDWQKLAPVVDAYTFSAHKFGALKGGGYSFVKNDYSFEPLLKGGGQQFGFRSGTENTLSIESIPIALEYMNEHYNFERQVVIKEDFEEKLKGLLGRKGEIVGCNDKDRNSNTIYFILYETKAQVSSMALDMAGFDVSNGSACSSGSVKPSRVLLAKGYSEELAKSAIRLSFSPYIDEGEAKQVWDRLKEVLVRFL